eukprot:gene1268-15649_t
MLFMRYHWNKYHVLQEVSLEQVPCSSRGIAGTSTMFFKRYAGTSTMFFKRYRWNKYHVLQEVSLEQVPCSSRGIAGTSTMFFKRYRWNKYHVLQEVSLEQVPCSSRGIAGTSTMFFKRKSGKGGGVGAYIGDGVVWDRRYDLDNNNIEAIWIEIRPKHSKSFLVGIRPPRPVRNRAENKFKFRPVSKLEVERDLKSIKHTKSTGIDNMPPGLLKDASCNLSAPLAHLINLSLQTGTFPADWKVAKVVPEHKSGSFFSFDNYRPISILPVLSKIIEKGGTSASHGISRS